MKRQAILFCISLFFILGVANKGFAQTFGGGLGTIEQPWLIKIPTHLEELSTLVLGGNTFLDKYFKLENDIDMGSISNFASIGKIGAEFQGSFNGNNKTISNLTINNSIGVNLGLFGMTEGSIISNLNLKDADIISGGCAGVLVGDAKNSTINNCHSSGKIIGSGITQSNMGGLVGVSQNSFFTECSSTTTVNSEGNMGGLIGGASNTSIENCFATGVLNGKNDVGGLVGTFINNLNINNSYYVGSLTGKQNVGGLIGSFGDNTSQGSISSTYSNAEITQLSGSLFVGAFIGDYKDNTPVFAITNSYYNKIENVKATGRSGFETLVNLEEKESNYMSSDCFVLDLINNQISPKPWQGANTKGESNSMRQNSGYPVLHWENRGYDDLSCGNNYYVTVNGSGNKSGDSWENAMDNRLLAESLVSADVNSIYYVAAGTYYPKVQMNGTPHVSESRLHTFLLNPGVSIIGSYRTDLTGTQNDLELHRDYTEDNHLRPTTIFTGDFDGDNKDKDDKDAFILLRTKITKIVGAQSKMNGIKFTRSAGGGLEFTYANVIIEFCQIEKLWGQAFGFIGVADGAVMGVFGGKMVIRNSDIRDNFYTSNDAFTDALGTIKVSMADMEIYNSTIINNIATSGESAISYYNENARVDDDGLEHYIRIYNSTIAENKVETTGIRSTVGVHHENCLLELVNTTIANNQAGGIALPKAAASATRLKIDNCIISGNTEYNFRLYGGTKDELVLFTQSGYNTPSQKPIYSLIGKHYFDATSTHSDVGFNTTQQHLASLAYNGGYTQTIALPSVVDNYALEHGNPLYAGSNVDVRNLHKDQRGVLRKETLPSIGAYEYIKPNKTVFGTVFPFVFNSEPEFDTLFTIVAKLYAVPPTGTDPIDEIYNSTPLHVDTVENYDGSIFVPGTPKKPGTYGSINNPGYPIDWSMLGKTQGTVNTMLLTESDNIPDSPIGLYTFENVVAGDYVLVLSRAGYVTRYAKVTVSEENTIVGHKELIPGDIDGNNEIDIFDASSIRTKFSSFGDPKYDAKYDIYTDGEIDIFDVSLVNYYMGFNLEMYNDTNNWLSEY